MIRIVSKGLAMRTHLKLFNDYFASCKKEDPLENKLEGSWELRHLNGSFLPLGTPDNYASGNGDIYKFSGNNFERQVGGKVINSGTFSVLKEDSNPNGKELEFKILFKGKYDMSAPFELSKNKLIMNYGSLASDGSIATYARL